MDDSINIDGVVMTTTTKAVLLSDGVEEFWLPRSQIDLVDGELEEGESVSINIPTWLAEKKGLL